MASKQSSLRMQRELSLLNNTSLPGIACWAVNDDILHLEANVCGPTGTPYEKGVFKLEIHIPSRYPFEPPKVRFVTPVHHPNIDSAGRICLDILKMPPNGSWKPSINVSTMLTSIQQLLAEPNPDDALDANIGAEFKFDRALFEARAREHTTKYACNTRVSAHTEQNTETSTTLGAERINDTDRDITQERTIIEPQSGEPPNQSSLSTDTQSNDVSRISSPQSPPMEPQLPSRDTNKAFEAATTLKRVTSETSSLSMSTTADTKENIFSREASVEKDSTVVTTKTATSTSLKATAATKRPRLALGRR